MEDLLPLLRAAPRPQGSENPRPSSQTWAPTPPLAPTPLVNAGTPPPLANGHAHAEAQAPLSPFQAPDAARADAGAAAASAGGAVDQAAQVAQREQAGQGMGVKPGLGLGSGVARPERLAALHALLAAGGDARLRHLAFLALMRLGGAPPTLYRDSVEDHLVGGGGAHTERLCFAGGAHSLYVTGRYACKLKLKGQFACPQG